MLYIHLESKLGRVIPMLPIRFSGQLQYFFPSLDELLGEVTPHRYW
jgi:hypothetical protein